MILTSAESLHSEEDPFANPLFFPVQYCLYVARRSASLYCMKYLRGRYLAFWVKYNYVLSAALSTAIAITGVVIFFAVRYNRFTVDWWGNDSESDCEASACTRLMMPKDEYFGLCIGTYV